jgi:Zn-dependent protease with chaperone function/competence protein ComGC
MMDASGFAGLNANNLTLPKERVYHRWVIAFSVLIWLGLAATIFGIFYAAIFAFFLWLGNGLMVAGLRSGAVKVSDQQMPALHAAFLEVCSRLSVSHPPALYVLQAGGVLNAFATRHAGRSFVVIYSDFLEALGPASAEMKFILGHEIGHIQSRHILKQILLAPGMFMPLLGPAYRRSWESSCDRYGAFAAADMDASLRAMLTLSGGREHGRTLNAETYAGQYFKDRGFFVSLHELTSSYPTLSQRAANLLALKQGHPAPKAEREPVAYFLALFMPAGGSAAPANAMVFIVIIGLLAAMAIPAFQKVRQTAQEKACFNNERMLVAALGQYQLENNHGPRNWSDIIGPDKYVKTMPACLVGGTYSADYDKTVGYIVKCSIHGTMANPALSRTTR